MCAIRVAVYYAVYRIHSQAAIRADITARKTGLQGSATLDRHPWPKQETPMHSAPTTKDFCVTFGVQGIHCGCGCCRKMAWVAGFELHEMWCATATEMLPLLRLGAANRSTHALKLWG